MRIRPRRPVTAIRLIALLAAVGLSAGGCVVQNNTVGAGGDSVGTAAFNAQPRSALRDGGNLRVAISELPENYNTNELDGTSLDTSFIETAMMPNSFVADAKGNLSVNHDYFTDIRLLPGSPQRVVFTLNPKAVWTDGTPITWADLKSEADAMSGRDPRYLVAFTSGYDQIAAVTEGVDDRQAIVSFTRPYSGWIGLFSLLYPKSLNDNPDTFNSGYRNTLPVSAGPFLLAGIDKIQGRVTLRRNPRWWGAKPRLDTITCLVLDPDSWVPALQNDEIDITDLPINSLSQVKAAKNASDIDVWRAPDPSGSFLTFNGAAGSPLADVRLRRAVAKAINRAAIAKAMQFGLTANPVPMNNHIYLAGQAGYQDNSAPVSYDPDAAAKELDALGWRRSGDTRVKDGKRLVLRYAVRSGQIATETAEIVQQNLADIGVRMDIEDHPGNDFFQQVLVPGDFDIASFGWVFSDFPMVALGQVYSWDPRNPQNNYGHIGSPAINDLINQAASELDPAKAAALANRVDQMLFDEVFSLPLYQSAGNYPVRSNVANYGAFGLGTADMTDIGFLK